MAQSILVLEENQEIQQLISASFKDSNISVINESTPELFLQKIKDFEPDLIFLSNSDSFQDYKVCREIREDPSTKKIPIILLLNAKDKHDEKLLSELQINGFLRKPFESTSLREQLSPYIQLDENFGNGPDESDEDFKIDMSSIDNQLQEIKKAKSLSDSPQEGEDQIFKSTEQGKNIQEGVNLKVNEMDSLVLENLSDQRVKDKEWVDVVKKDSEEVELISDETAEIKEEKISENFGEITDDEIDMESGFEFELKLDEEELEDRSDLDDVETALPFDNSSTDGLEKLKISGLEDQFAKSRLNDQKDEVEEKFEGEMTGIDLEVNDFEEQNETWQRPPEIDLYHKTPREGLEDINFDESDFQRELPKNYTQFDDQKDYSVHDFDETVDEDVSSIKNDMDNIELEQNDLEKDLGLETLSDNIILIDSKDLNTEPLKETEDSEKFGKDFPHEFDSDDTEIKSMVQDSFNVQEKIEESGLEELEDLNDQMEALESEEKEFEVDEAEFESDGAEFEADEAEFEADEAKFVVDENELDRDESKFETDETELGTDEVEFEEDFDKENIETAETSIRLNEDVFDNWDEAEDAFLSFDREASISEKYEGIPEIEESVFNDDKEYQDKSEESGSYRFTEEELKDIVSSSVKQALEKSIATSLVELAVSELKTKVNQMDQDLA